MQMITLKMKQAKKNQETGTKRISIRDKLLVKGWFLKSGNMRYIIDVKTQKCCGFLPFCFLPSPRLGSQQVTVTM